MNKEAVFHINTEEFVYPVSRKNVVFRIRTARKDIKLCSLVYWDRTKPKQKKKLTMVCYQRDELFDYFQCCVEFTKIARYQKYYFEITDLDGMKWFYTSNGLKNIAPDKAAFEYLYSNETDVFKEPDWINGVVYYQIFPERFCNGDSNNDPDLCEKWGTLPTRDNYMGGDLKGILLKLPYLKDLGIECIYLNPIFYGDFNHKYATTDYFQIDPMFGTKEVFKELVDKCHAQNLKLILDGVFNHVGIHFKQFQDVLEKQEQSEYANWFYINKFPFSISHHDYECVGAYKWMPKLNTGNPEVRKFIISVMDYWIKEFHIDGWRLDVADEVDPAVWQEARLALKGKYPSIVLIGETWGYGGKMLRGNQMDSVMNYLFRDSVIKYFAEQKISAVEFDHQINHMLAIHKEETNHAMYNLIDSHDTERFLFACNGNKSLLKLAVAFQMTFPGSPAIYYGDEVGITGDNDPDCRRCMEWGLNADESLLEWYRKLIHIHKSYSCFRKGKYRTIVADNTKDVFGFIRFDEESVCYVVINRSPNDTEICLPVIDAKEGEVFTDIITGDDFKCSKLVKRELYNGDITEYVAQINMELEACSVKVISKK